MLFNIPQYCPQCRAVYPTGIVLDETASIGISSCQFGCPKGHTSSILEGTFRARDGVLHVFGAGGDSRPVLERIRQLAEAAIAGDTDQNAAIDAIAALAPSLAPMLKATKGSSGLVALALVLWFIVEMTKAFNSGDSSQPRPIIIQNTPTVVNEITIGQNLPHQVYKSSKRKKQRDRGKKSPAARQQLIAR